MCQVQQINPVVAGFYFPCDNSAAVSNTAKHCNAGGDSGAFPIYKMSLI